MALSKPLDPSMFIATLTAVSSITERGFQLPCNDKRYIGPPVLGTQRKKREATPVDNGVSKEHKILLTLEQPPKDKTAGYVFGSEEETCDVRLVDEDSFEKEAHIVEYISRKHFSLRLDIQRRLVLRNLSDCRMSVSYDNQAATRYRRKGFHWIIFPWYSLITVSVPMAHTIFKIELAQHNNDRRMYWQHVDRVFPESIRQGGCRIATPFDLLTMHSQSISIADSGAASPVTRPITIQGRFCGKGSYGSVHEYINVSTGDIIGAGKSFKSGEDKREHDMLSKVNHKHIVTFLCFYTEPAPLLMMEHAEHGDFYKADKQRQFTFEECLSFLYQASQGLFYLHDKRKIMHRDIKPNNMLIFSRVPLLMKFGDFGFAKHDEQPHIHTDRGTLPYKAPEIWGNNPYNDKVDIWSLGVVALELLYGLPVHEHKKYAPGEWIHAVRDFAEARIQQYPAVGAIHFIKRRMLTLEHWERCSALECIIYFSNEIKRLAPASLPGPQPQLTKPPTEYQLARGRSPAVLAPQLQALGDHDANIPPKLPTADGRGSSKRQKLANEHNKGEKARPSKPPQARR